MKTVLLTCMCCGHKQKDSSDKFRSYVAPSKDIDKHYKEWPVQHLDLCEECADKWTKKFSERLNSKGIDPKSIRFSLSILDESPRAKKIHEAISEGNEWLFTRVRERLGMLVPPNGD